MMDLSIDIIAILEPLCKLIDLKECWREKVLEIQISPELSIRVGGKRGAAARTE